MCRACAAERAEHAALVQSVHASRVPEQRTKKGAPPALETCSCPGTQALVSQAPKRLAGAGVGDGTDDAGMRQHTCRHARTPSRQYMRHLGMGQSTHAGSLTTSTQGAQETAVAARRLRLTRRACTKCAACTQRARHRYGERPATMPGWWLTRLPGLACLYTHSLPTHSLKASSSLHKPAHTHARPV